MMVSIFRGPLFRSVDEFTQSELDAALRCAVRRSLDAAIDLDAGVRVFDLQQGATEFVEGLDVLSLGFFVATVPAVAAAELLGLGGLLVELAKMRAAVGSPAELVRKVERCLDCDRWGRAGELCPCDADLEEATASEVRA
jgi:hypothetical protein